MQLYQYRIRPTRVVDGDTIDAEIDLGMNTFIKERIRLYGVDTPEVYGPHAVPEGKLASDFTKDWMAAGQTFYLSSDRYDWREKYGRVLGRIFRDEDPVSVNEALLNAGHAKDYR